MPISSINAIPNDTSFSSMAFSNPVSPGGNRLYAPGQVSKQRKYFAASSIDKMKDEEIIEYLETLKQDARENTTNIRTHWKKNERMYTGAYTRFVTSPPTGQEPMYDPASFYLTDVIISIMTDARPKIYVVPKTQDIESIQKSQDTEKVVDFIWTYNGMDMQIELCVLYMLIYGTAFIKACWNPLARGGVGEIVLEVINPKQITFDAYAKKWDDIKYICYEWEDTLFNIQRKYNLATELTSSPDNSLMSIALSAGLRIGKGVVGVMTTPVFTEHKVNYDPLVLDSGRMDLVTPVTRTTTSGASDKIIVNEFWICDDTIEIFDDPYEEAIKDSEGIVVLDEKGNPLMEEKFTPIARKKYPYGRTITYVSQGQKTILAMDKSPYKTFPFVPVYNQFSNSLWGDTEFPLISEMQNNLNRFLDYVYAHFIMNSSQPIIVDKGALRNVLDITNDPTQIIEIDPNARIERLIAQALPQEIFILYQTMKNIIYDTLGITEALQGKRQGARSDKALQRLQESGYSRIGKKVRHLDSALERLGSIILDLVLDYYKEDRVFKILAPRDKKQNQVIFNSSGMDDSWSIIMSAGDSLPVTRIGRIDLAMELQARRVIGKKTLLAELDWPHPVDAINDINQEMQQEAQMQEEVRSEKGNVAANKPRGAEGEFVPSAPPTPPQWGTAGAPGQPNMQQLIASAMANPAANA